MWRPRFLRLLMELKQVLGWPRASTETWAPPLVEIFTARHHGVGRSCGVHRSHAPMDLCQRKLVVGDVYGHDVGAQAHWQS